MRSLLSLSLVLSLGASLTGGAGTDVAHATSPSPLPCLDRIAIQDGYSFLKANERLYFHQMVHKRESGDWYAANDNAPWGNTPIADIDLAETPKGRAKPGIPVGIVSAGSNVYRHSDLRDLAANDWTAINFNKPWGSQTVTNVSIAGRHGNQTMHGAASAGNSAYYFATETAGNPFTPNFWMDVSDNRPWGNAAIQDIDLSVPGRALVLAGGVIYIHNNLQNLAKQDWRVAPMKDAATLVPLANAERLDNETTHAIASRGSDAFFTTGFAGSSRWKNIGDNRPWGAAHIEDVANFEWYTGVEPWGTRVIAMLVAGDKPYLHWRPANVAKAGARNDWEDASDNAPWKTDGACDTPVPPPPPSGKGCIDVLKETYDSQGRPLTPVAQFTFRLDNNTRVGRNNGAGRVRFINVAPGWHTVTEIPYPYWQQISVTPPNGSVYVRAGSQCAAVVFKNRQLLHGGNQSSSAGCVSGCSSGCGGGCSSRPY